MERIDGQRLFCFMYNQQRPSENMVDPFSPVKMHLACDEVACKSIVVCIRAGSEEHVEESLRLIFDFDKDMDSLLETSPYIGSLLLADQDSMDFNLRTEDNVSLHVHRNVLNVQSGYFRALRGFKEDTSSEVSVTGNSNAWKCLLHMIYERSMSLMTVDNMSMVVELVIKYDFNFMDLHAWKFVQDQTNKETAIPLFMLACRHDNAILLDKCVMFIRDMQVDAIPDPVLASSFGEILVHPEFIKRLHSSMVCMHVYVSIPPSLILYFVGV
jgi:hypothetical protein